MKVLKEIINKIKGFWNIYGGIIASTTIAWLNDFAKTTMDAWTSYLVLTLTCISVLTFFKIMLFKNKPNGAIDSAALSQKSVKALKTAVDPFSNGEELGNTIIYTIKEGKGFMVKLKKIFKLIWGNKLTLLSIISNLVVTAFAQFLIYSDVLKDFKYFQDHNIVFKVVITILCLLWLINNIYTAVTKYGIENLEELAARAANLQEETVNKLSTADKKALKALLSEFNDKLTNVEAKIIEIDKTIEAAQEIIKQFDIITKLGIALTPEQEQQYRNAENTIKVEEQNKQTLCSQKGNVETQINKLKEALAA